MKKTQDLTLSPEERLMIAIFGELPSVEKRSEIIGRIAIHVAGLEPDLGDVIRLRYGPTLMSYRKIAEVLLIGNSTSEQREARAIKAFRKAFGVEKK
jgi:hypothetical protein